jgi:Class II Aldolase and Adducin N-terminal domain
MTRIETTPKKFSLIEREPAVSFEEERLHRKQRLAATFRLFGHYGFDQGLAGHVTVRDPEHSERFWINPLASISARSGCRIYNSSTIRAIS